MIRYHGAIPVTEPSVSVAQVRPLGSAEVAGLLGCSDRTARRRLARWEDEGHPVTRERSPHGEARYAIARHDLARIIPEIDDDG